MPRPPPSTWQRPPPPREQPTEPPAAPPAELPPEATRAGADAGAEAALGRFYLRRVCVDRLPPDGSLGLLLHGTSVVGFSKPGVEDAGWAVGDQIVEVNGEAVASFDEFAAALAAAREVPSCPLRFGVLRRGRDAGAGGGPATDGSEAEAPLRRFLDAADLVDLAAAARRRPAGTGSSPTGGTGCARAPSRSCEPGTGGAREPVSAPLGDSIMDNPYIKALQHRRSELCRSAETLKDPPGTLAARLASQQHGTLATMTERPRRTPTEPPACAPLRLSRLSLGAPWSPCAPVCDSDSVGLVTELRPTPRADTWDQAVATPLSVFHEDAQPEWAYSTPRPAKPKAPAEVKPWQVASPPDAASGSAQD